MNKYLSLHLAHLCASGNIRKFKGVKRLLFVLYPSPVMKYLSFESWPDFQLYAMTLLIIVIGPLCLAHWAFCMMSLICPPPPTHIQTMWVNLPPPPFSTLIFVFVLYWLTLNEFCWFFFFFFLLFTKFLGVYLIFNFRIDVKWFFQNKVLNLMTKPMVQFGFCSFYLWYF